MGGGEGRERKGRTKIFIYSIWVLVDCKHCKDRHPCMQCVQCEYMANKTLIAPHTSSGKPPTTLKQPGQEVPLVTGLDRFHCTDSYYTYTGIVWNLSIVATV